MNYQAKIDIKKLNRAFVHPVQGKDAKVECVCIPVDEFYKGKNGELYCNLQLQERKEIGQYGDTHFVKQSLEKESYAKLTDEQKKTIPILGSFQPSKFNNTNDAPAQTAPTPTKTESDTLPF
jgi:hypothetical protein